MKHAFHQSAVAALVLLVAPLSHAESSPFFMGADTSFALSYREEPASPDFTVTSETSTILGMRTYLGYQITRNLDVELGMTHRTLYRQEASSRFASYQVAAKATNKDILLTYHLRDHLPGVFLLTGMVWTNIDIDATVKIFGRESNASGEINHRHYALGIGYERPFNDNLYWRVTYTRYGPGKLATLGLKYQFGK